MDLLLFRTKQHARAARAAPGDKRRDGPGVNWLVLRIPELVCDVAGWVVVLSDLLANLGLSWFRQARLAYQNSKPIATGKNVRYRLEN